MVRIKKGKLEKDVTKSSFENYYKNSGWIVKGKSNVNVSVKSSDIDDSSDEWDSIEEEYKEKPVSEMNRQELEQKAISLGIDLNGLGSTKQLREAIRKQIG